MNDNRKKNLLLLALFALSCAVLLLRPVSRSGAS
jgi:hypothetical protein